MNASCIDKPAFDAGSAREYVRNTIVPAVAARYRVPLEELTGSYLEERAEEMFWPRCVTMWLARELCGVVDSSIAPTWEATSLGFRRCVQIVERAMDTYPEIKTSLHEFFREIHLPGSCLIGRINELDRTVRNLETGGCNGGL